MSHEATPHSFQTCSDLVNLQVGLIQIIITYKITHFFPGEHSLRLSSSLSNTPPPSSLTTPPLLPPDTGRSHFRNCQPYLKLWLRTEIISTVSKKRKSNPTSKNIKPTSAEEGQTAANATLARMKPAIIGFL